MRKNILIRENDSRKHRYNCHNVKFRNRQVSGFFYCQAVKNMIL